jgi:hypothetical protein
MSYAPNPDPVATRIRWSRVRPGGLSVPILTLREDHGQMGAGGSGARLVTCSDGERWVMKSPILGGQRHPFFCLNEAIGGLVGHRLGANVPEVAVVELTLEQVQTYDAAAAAASRFVVATRLIEPAEPLSPDTAVRAEKGEVAGLVALDALIANTDAKEEHVLAYREDADDDRWRLAAIDRGHSLAMGSNLASFASDAPAAPPVPLLAQQIAAADLARWVEKARAVRREEFLEMVRVLPGTWVVEPDGAETLADALFQRAQDLDRVLAPHFHPTDNV